MNEVGEFMNPNYARMSTKELKDLKSYLELDKEKFKKELEDISEELLLRTLPYCRPVIDLIR